MNKWEYNVADLHGMKRCKVEVSDRLKYKLKTDPDLKKIINLCWAIYVRNGPIWLTIPMPEHLGVGEVNFHHENGTIYIS